MPPKKIQAPVDRPLSKAYLREFSGWATAHSPSLSEPNSLRQMENVIITEAGGAAVRPGMRSLLQEKLPYPIVGSHEVFYLEDGRRAFLIAVREPTAITFRVITFSLDADNQERTDLLTLSEAGFETPAGDDTISFSTSATYVRYLQIDNKIFALSNNDEPMLMFWVGKDHKARRLAKIDRPEWDPADRCQVRHPNPNWTTDADRVSYRINRVPNPDFETTLDGWGKWHNTKYWRTSSASWEGTRSLAFAGLPTRVNYMRAPLHDVPTYGIDDWGHPSGDSWNGCYRLGTGSGGTGMKIYIDSSGGTTYSLAYQEMIPIPGNTRMRIAFDILNSTNVRIFEVRVRYYSSSKELLGPHERVGGTTFSNGQRVYSDPFETPSQARYMHVYIGGRHDDKGKTTWMDVQDVYLGESAGISSGLLDPLDGDRGSDYYWEGTPNQSRSEYFPPIDCGVGMDSVPAWGTTFYASAYVRANNVDRDVTLRVRSYNSQGQTTKEEDHTELVGSPWQRMIAPAFDAPSDTTEIKIQVIGRGMQRGGTNNVCVDGVLLQTSHPRDTYFSGSYPADTETIQTRWEGTPHNSRSFEEEFTRTSNPGEATPTEDTLISSRWGDNVYSFGFFYTISNDIGASAPSKPKIVRTQRPWTQWAMTEPNAAGEPSNIGAVDPSLAADQLVVTIPEDVFDAAVAAGATHWNAYFYNWGPEDVPPVTALKFAEVPLNNNPTYGIHSWARLTPEILSSIGNESPLVPTEKSRLNSTDPSRGSQGLVAADRMVLVGDPSDGATVSWSSGATGEYHNFDSALGGGTKTLASGNLYLTAAAKLWRNPQAVDTITILNRGDEGRSNAYYMQPAQITTLSESISVMGFEEVSGMEGTSSPYGCEVFNNGLYHPLQRGIVKSTTNNYSIYHSYVTDDIENQWMALQNHHRIVSSQLRGQIFYLVHNRFGEQLEEGCIGNEIWVLDVRDSTPVWSRWLVQGASLRTLEFNNKVSLSVARPDGIFVFDHVRTNDEFFDAFGQLKRRNISWYLETNTQGANRAHDAWANLQQANITVSKFDGTMRYGIRGKDVHGMDVDIEKLLYAEAPPATRPDSYDAVTEFVDFLNPQDREDYFQIRKVMKEWVFYAGSVQDDTEVPYREMPSLMADESLARYSAGEIALVQYRYSPISVNVGYEYGSVETFEYGRSNRAGAVTDSGTPKPYIDLPQGVEG